MKLFYDSQSASKFKINKFQFPLKKKNEMCNKFFLFFLFVCKKEQHKRIGIEIKKKI